MPSSQTPRKQRSTCLSHCTIVISSITTLSSFLFNNISRLNQFNRSLRPAALFTLCLIFGITPADPVLHIRWLAYLAGVRFTPTGLNDLARPHYYLVYNDIVFRLCTLCIGLVPFSVVMNSSTLLSNAVAIWIESNAERLYLLAIS